MKFKFTLQLGINTLEIEDEANTHSELIRKIAFFHSLPQEGPGGEDDLIFTHRSPQDFDYYAIECRSSGMEFQLGQYKEPKG